MKKRAAQQEVFDDEVEIGSGSVFADLGLKNHKEMETKADMVIQISKSIKKHKLTQVKAAQILRISQPKLSELLKGHFRGYSVDRLMRFLNDLGEDVEIIIKSKPCHRKARVSVRDATGDCCSAVPIAAKGNSRAH